MEAEFDDGVRARRSASRERNTLPFCRSGNVDRIAGVVRSGRGDRWLPHIVVGGKPDVGKACIGVVAGLGVRSPRVRRRSALSRGPELPSVLLIVGERGPRRRNPREAVLDDSLGIGVGLDGVDRLADETSKFGLDEGSTPKAALESVEEDAEVGACDIRVLLSGQIVFNDLARRENSAGDFVNHEF